MLNIEIWRTTPVKRGKTGQFTGRDIKMPLINRLIYKSFLSNASFNTISIHKYFSERKYIYNIFYLFFYEIIRKSAVYIFDL